ncbi:MAG: DUF2249 domain-containing protein [Rhodobacteraceae bacterium]|nr:DUF2249 domain-containing protein [Paracoccaceae bacterium]
MIDDLPGRHWMEEDGLHVDVRDLAAPEPMIAILGRLETLATDGPVIVHHFCEPAPIYDDLADLGWTCEVVPGDEDEVRLILRRSV